MADIGLNENHQQEIVNYLRFARYNRGQKLKSIDGSFTDLKDSRLLEDTFTVDEVTEMLDGLCAVVRGEVEMELLNAAHTNVLLLRQLFSQAEKWHLKLQADISELENAKLLEEIAQFEENHFSAGKSQSTALSSLSQKPKLQPLNEGGNTALLQIEINRLSEENAKLKDRVQMLEKKALAALDDKSKLQSDLSHARTELSNKGNTPNNTKTTDGEIQKLSEQMMNLSEELTKAKAIADQKCATTEEELSNTKHYVLALLHEVETLTQLQSMGKVGSVRLHDSTRDNASGFSSLAKTMNRVEMDNKFNNTTQYRNMKKMLEGKNTQIKDLRARLKKYEPDLEI